MKQKLNDLQAETKTKDTQLSDMIRTSEESRKIIAKLESENSEFKSQFKIKCEIVDDLSTSLKLQQSLAQSKTDENLKLITELDDLMAENEIFKKKMLNVWTTIIELGKQRIKDSNKSISFWE